MNPVLIAAVLAALLAVVLFAIAGIHAPRRIRNRKGL